MFNMMERVQKMTTEELAKELALYEGLQSRGVKDEVWISVMQSELARRGSEV